MDDKKLQKLAKSEQKSKVTADSIVNDLMKLEPSQLLKYIAKQENSDAKAWILKNLIPFAAYVVKNGFIKTKALTGAVKDINKKNKDDMSGIDYDNVEIENSSIKTVYAFDDETIKKLQDFINEYKKQMEDAKADIEQSSEKLNKDIKKAGVKIDGDKLSDNALVVAGVIDNKKNKGKSGKELTKIVDQKIENKKEFDKIQKKSEKITKKINNIKVNPKYTKMSIEQLEKIAKDNAKKTEKSNKNKNKQNESLQIESKLNEDAASNLKNIMSQASIDGNRISKFSAPGALTQIRKIFDIDNDKLIEIANPVKTKNALKSAKAIMQQKMQTFLINYEKNPSEAIKTLTKNLSPERKDAYAEIMCKLKPEAISEFKKAGINVNGTFDKLGDIANAASDVEDTAKAASDAKDIAKSTIDNATEKVTSGDTKIIGSALVDGKGRIFNASNMARQINKFDNMTNDGNIDPSEFKKIANFENQLSEYQEWATENANSDDPVIQAKIAQVKYITNKFNSFKTDCGDMLQTDEADAVANRIPDAASNSKEIAKLANNEQTKELTKGFWGKAGQMLKVFGQAKAVAKIGKFILNDGKDIANAIGGQWMKFKEDQNVIAEMKFILMNGDDSKSNRSDTKFSVRFDTSDLKWHLTNLDDRKAKIEKEDVLIDKILNTQDCKDFKKECINAWTEILQPKDPANKFIPYFIKNYDKLGMKISDKNIKKYFDTLRILADNFNEVKKQFA